MAGFKPPILEGGLDPGEQGAVDSILALTPDQVPKAGAGVLLDSTTEERTNGSWLFGKDVEVPGGSIAVGEVIRISEGAGDLIVTDFVQSTNAFSVNSKFDDTGASNPTFIDYAAVFTNNLQPVDTTVITANPLNFSLTTVSGAGVTRLTTEFTIRANGPMNNVSARFVDNVTGIAIRYIPNKLAFDSGIGGLNLLAGDSIIDLIAVGGTPPAGTFNLGVNPFVTQNGQQVDVQIKGDSIDLLGNATSIPFITLQDQDGLTESIASVPAVGIANHIVSFDGSGGFQQSEDVILRATGGATDPTIIIQDSGGSSEFVISADFSSGNNGIVSASPLTIETTGNNELQLTTALGNVVLETTSASNEILLVKSSEDDESHVYSIQQSGTNPGLVLVHVGDRSPEGNVLAPNGALYHRTGATPQLFHKTGGTTTTGWVDISTPPAAGGDVFGPASSIDNTLAMFDGVTGKVIDQAVDVIYASSANVRNVRIDSPNVSGVVGWELHDSSNVKRGELTYVESASTLTLVQRDSGTFTIETIGTGNIEITTTAANSTIDLSCGSTGSITLDAGLSAWIFGNDTLETTASGATTTSQIEFKNSSLATVATVATNHNTSQLLLSTPTNYNIELNCTDGDIRAITQGATNSLLIDNGALPDTLAGVRIVQGGANGGDIDIFAGTRNPESNVTANGGAIYAQDSATTPNLYQKTGDATNAGWFKLKKEGASNLTVSIIEKPLIVGSFGQSITTAPQNINVWTAEPVNTDSARLDANVAADRIDIVQLTDVQGDLYRIDFNATFRATQNVRMDFDIVHTINGVSSGALLEVQHINLGSASSEQHVSLSGVVRGPTSISGVTSFQVHVAGNTSATVNWDILYFSVERIS